LLRRDRQQQGRGRTPLRLGWWPWPALCRRPRPLYKGPPLGRRRGDQDRRLKAGLNVHHCLWGCRAEYLLQQGQSGRGRGRLLLRAHEFRPLRRVQGPGVAGRRTRRRERPLVSPRPLASRRCGLWPAGTEERAVGLAGRGVGRGGRYV
jgi:hypothetical protein